MDSRDGGGPVMQGPSISINTDVRPPETTVSNGARPVMNYSIRTGEEFALEFMRERVISKKPTVLNSSEDQNYTTGYTDSRGVLGISHAGSESVSDVSKLTSDKTLLKDMEKRHLSEIENKGRYANSRSVPRASSGVSHGYSSSGTSNSLSKKMKVLCSFGGKILPRPSDGKLRYVGGDTRIIRISKDISWQELMQKTMMIYNQPHTVKYQLPGEDLDALVSVSCDEDLQNMVEECSVLEGCEGSQKLRMFLYSSNEFDDIHYGLGSIDGDSEIHYMVAVNGIDPGTGKPSSDHGLAITSVSDLDQLLNLKVEVEDQDNKNRSAAASAGIPKVDFGSGLVSSTTFSSPLQASLSSEYDPYLHSYQAHRLHFAEGSHHPLSATPVPGDFHNVNSRISIPGSMRSDYNYSSQSTLIGGSSVPVPLQEPLFVHHGGNEVDDALLQFAIQGSLSNHRALDSDDLKGKKVMEECVVVTDVVEVPDTEIGESSHSSQKDPEEYCSICMEPKFRYECFHIKDCSHYYCASCVGRYVEAKVEENVSSIRCPDPSCKDGFLEPEMCQKIVNPNVFDRWGSALCEAMIGSMKFYCPFKDCSALLIDEEGAADGEITQSECPHCCRLFCARCKVPWHVVSCEEYQKLGEDEREREDVMLKEMASSCRWQRCPFCKFYVEKISGCMFMTCRCGNKFCYGCATTMTIDHYCTKCKR